MNFFTFAELCGLLEMLIEKENDKTLLRAYQMSYAALRNISFDDFRRDALGGVLQSTAQPSAEETLNKAENFLNDYKWEAI